MSASGQAAPVHQVITTFHPAARRHGHFGRQHYHRGGHVNFLVSAQTQRTFFTFQIQANRRVNCASEPVDRYDGQYAVPVKRAAVRALPVAPEIQFFINPRSQPGRRIIQAAGKRSRTRSLDKIVTALLFVPCLLAIKKSLLSGG